MFSSTSLKYSRLGRPLFERVHSAFMANSDLCHDFLLHCTDYGKNMRDWCHFSVALLASPVGDPPDLSDLQERITRLRSNLTVSTENAASAQAQGLSLFNLVDALSTPTSPITDQIWVLLFTVQQGHGRSELLTTKP